MSTDGDGDVLGFVEGTPDDVEAGFQADRDRVLRPENTHMRSKALSLFRSRSVSTGLASETVTRYLIGFPVTSLTFQEDGINASAYRDVLMAEYRKGLTASMAAVDSWYTPIQNDARCVTYGEVTNDQDAPRVVQALLGMTAAPPHSVYGVGFGSTVFLKARPNVFAAEITEALLAACASLHLFAEPRIELARVTKGTGIDLAVAYTVSTRLDTLIRLVLAGQPTAIVARLRVIAQMADGHLRAVCPDGELKPLSALRTASSRRMTTVTTPQAWQTADTTAWSDSSTVAPAPASPSRPPQSRMSSSDSAWLKAKRPDKPRMVRMPPGMDNGDVDDQDGSQGAPDDKTN